MWGRKVKPTAAFTLVHTQPIALSTHRGPCQRWHQNGTGNCCRPLSCPKLEPDFWVPVFHLSTMRMSCLLRSNCSEPWLTVQLFWLLFPPYGHSASALNPEGHAGHGALQIFLWVTLVSPLTAFLPWTMLSPYLQLFLEAILTTRLSLLWCAVTVMKHDVNNSSDLLPRHFPAPASQMAAPVLAGMGEKGKAGRGAWSRRPRPGRRGDSSWELRDRGLGPGGRRATVGGRGTPLPAAWPEGASNSCCSPAAGLRGCVGAGAQGAAAEGWETGLHEQDPGLGPGEELEGGLQRPGPRGRRSEAKGGGGGHQLLKMSRGQGWSQRLALEEWRRRKHPGSKPGQRAEAWEGKGQTVQQGPEAPPGRARETAAEERVGERHQEPEQGPGNMGKQLKWGGREGKTENRGFGGWGRAQLLRDRQGRRRRRLKSHSQGERSQWPPLMEENKDWERSDGEYSHFKSKILSLHIKHLSCFVFLRTAQRAHSWEHAGLYGEEALAADAGDLLDATAAAGSRPHGCCLDEKALRCSQRGSATHSSFSSS